MPKTHPLKTTKAKVKKPAATKGITETTEKTVVKKALKTKVAAKAKPAVSTASGAKKK